MMTRPPSPRGMATGQHGATVHRGLNTHSLLRLWAGPLALLLAFGPLAVPAWAQHPIQVAENSSKSKPAKTPHGKGEQKGDQKGADAPRADTQPQPAGPGHLGQSPAALGRYPQLDTMGGSGDLAFGAYQRGFYITAFHEALRRIKEQNDPVAMTLLAELYTHGFGVPHDPKKAIEWYQKAADKGSSDAQFALGLMALTGDGRPADEEEAARMFRKAADKGNAAAAYNLGLLYMQGRKVQKDMKQAAHWFEIAAERDLEDAQYALAVLLKSGNGVERDLPGAAQLMGRAANLGHVTAQVEFAIMQFNGIGVPKDEEAAAAMFRRAALAGNAIAQNRYARLLAAGRGVSPDPVAAVTWHLMAKSRGLGDPMLDGVADKLSPADRQKAEDQARRWGADQPADAKTHYVPGQTAPADGKSAPAKPAQAKPASASPAKPPPAKPPSDKSPPAKP